jgi:hypothetical protein
VSWPSRPLQSPTDEPAFHCAGWAVKSRMMSRMSIHRPPDAPMTVARVCQGTRQRADREFGPFSSPGGLPETGIGPVPGLIVALRMPAQISNWLRTDSVRPTAPSPPRIRESSRRSYWPKQLGPPPIEDQTDRSAGHAFTVQAVRPASDIRMCVQVVIPLAGIRDAEDRQALRPPSIGNANPLYGTRRVVNNRGTGLHGDPFLPLAVTLRRCVRFWLHSAQ